MSGPARQGMSGPARQGMSGPGRAGHEQQEMGGGT
jgi:hypothetical protein